MPLVLQGQSQLSSVGLPSMLVVHIARRQGFPRAANRHLETPDHFNASPSSHPSGLTQWGTISPLWPERLLSAGHHKSTRL